MCQTEGFLLIFSGGRLSGSPFSCFLIVREQSIYICVSNLFRCCACLRLGTISMTSISVARRIMPLCLSRTRTVFFVFPTELNSKYRSNSVQQWSLLRLPLTSWIHGKVTTDFLSDFLLCTPFRFRHGPETSTLLKRPTEDCPEAFLSKFSRCNLLAYMEITRLGVRFNARTY